MPMARDSTRNPCRARARPVRTWARLRKNSMRMRQRHRGGGRRPRQPSQPAHGLLEHDGHPGTTTRKQSTGQTRGHDAVSAVVAPTSTTVLQFWLWLLSWVFLTLPESRVPPIPPVMLSLSLSLSLSWGKARFKCPRPRVPGAATPGARRCAWGRPARAPPAAGLSCPCFWTPFFRALPRKVQCVSSHTIT